MILRIRYKSKPDSPGFEYRASAQATARGPDAERKELVLALRSHVLVYFTQETVTEGGKEVTRKLDPADVEATLTDEDGTAIGELPIPSR